MLTIPKELQEAMHASHGRPLRLTDPETQAEYGLLQAEMYDQLRIAVQRERADIQSRITRGVG